MANEVLNLGTYHDDEANAHPIEWEVVASSTYAFINPTNSKQKKYIVKMIVSKYPIGIISGKELMTFCQSEEAKKNGAATMFTKAINARYVPLTFSFDEQIKLMEEKMVVSERKSLPKSECYTYFCTTGGYLLGRMESVPFGTYETSKGTELIPIIHGLTSERVVLIKHAIGEEKDNRKQDTATYWFDVEQDAKLLESMTLGFHACTKIAEPIEG